MTAPAECTLVSRTLALLLLDDHVVDCNERFCRMLGRGRDEILGKTFLDLCPEVQSDGAFSRERWQRRWHAARAGLPQWFPWQFRAADGGRARGLVHLVVDPACEPRILAEVHDLTRIRDAGWSTPDSESRVQKVLDLAKAIVAVKDRDGRYLFANRELERSVRTPAERIVGFRDEEIWSQEIAQRFCTHDDEVLREGRAVEFEVTANVAGQPRTFQTFKFPLFSDGGDIYALCGVATDVTEHKRTQDALTEAALAVSSAQGGSVLPQLVRYLATILEVDVALIAAPCEGATGRMRVHAYYIDGEIRENFDYPVAGTPCERVVGQSFRIYPAGLRDTFAHDPYFNELGLESYAGFPLSDTAGAPIGLIAVLSRNRLTNAEFVESILKIFAVRAAAELERQRAEEALRHSEASYRSIFEASEDAIFVHDFETGAIIDVNQRACEIYGYTADEMRRITVGQISAGEHPYTEEEARKKLAQARGGATVRFEWHRRNKDGSLHWDEVVLRPAMIAGERRLLAFSREITERKQAEQAMRQAQKMEALGHLTGGIAHDFNNLLTSIMGYVVLAADHPAAGADQKLARYLEQAQLSCGRARDLIQQMLTFSRAQRGQPRPVSLAPLIQESVKLFRSSLPSTIDVHTSLDAHAAAVMLDPVHLDQILLNLCLNARDAMSGVGTIEVAVRQAPGTQGVCTACSQAAAGNFVELCVQDDGPGIASDIVERIFDPFFTTKEVGKGSGMGLATVHGIVHEAGGHIIVETEIGRGTRFRVFFPALNETGDSATAAVTARPRGPARRLKGRVLVVDDEQAVGVFMSDLLESWGIEATVATSPLEAAALFQREPRPFDLVITDQAMPRKTGVELARELCEKCCDVPVILYSGFNENLAREDIDRARIRAVLRKPVDPHELFGLLQTHLPHT
ncbi:MAG TPA: PAS domain S-box protein [Burkholderiales bacterium]|nr:PAS domain S-box protein [Burkholderiales bacterium]